MAHLVLGPLLRYASDTEATVWVQTDGPCEVAVLGHRARTFELDGLHVAVVRVRGLQPGSATPYEVALDGERRWPPSDDGGFPPSCIRTLPGSGEPLDLAFGSCRLTLPHREPYDLLPDQHEQGRGVDALEALAERMRAEGAFPHLLLLIGDQIYADEVSPATREVIRARRDTSQPPGEEVADLAEYAELYRESWTDPPVRWLLSTVPSAMVFDDHDVHDDWNTSAAWVAGMRAKGWWEERIVSALMSYWLFQHLGNLSPAELDGDPLLAQVEACGGDAAPLVRDFARRADRDPASVRWSYARALGRSRLVVVDARAGRVLDPQARDMLDEHEWAWLEDELRGDVEHLVVASTLPVLLSPALHELEAADEAIASGAWGRRAARLAEHVRQGLDLEHWSAFGRSFRRLWRLLTDVGAGRRGAPPASIVLLGGDVHHAYLAEVGFPAGSGVASHVFQAVCSPIRHPLGRHERRAVLAAWSPAAHRITRRLARAAGVERPPVGWRLVHDRPWTDNQLAGLRLEERHAVVHLDRAVKDPGGLARLERIFEHRLA
ncbi:MAG TPA: alkaline phosphatase D family protein [Baekduia sp.]|nr:alkaline phosphatase D family protein [Baekduia sp.]